MNAIVAVDQNWGIGREGKLLAHIPEDMRFFREKTRGKVVIMGRRTLESLPGGRPLRDRVNVVLTTEADFAVEGAVAARDLAELKALIRPYAPEELFVIGGGQVYRALLPECEQVFVTKIQRAYPADTFFPNLDQMAEWRAEQGEPRCHEVCTYTRIG